MKHFFLVLFFIGCALVTAQTEDGPGTGLELPDINSLVNLPNSPEAEAFAKYGNIPVSYYTGKPNVSVPIYTIQGKEMSVPVSLTYDPSGIKVQSISTSAGAGWNLNAGGMVSRQIHGLPDDIVSGKQHSYSITNSAVKELNTYLNSLRDPEYGYYFNFERYEHEHTQIIKFRQMKNQHSLLNADLMPDVYSFHAPGLSGSVMIDPDTGLAVSLKDPDIKAEYILKGENTIIGWTITNSAGTVYYFTVAEETTTTFSSSEGPEGPRVYNSAWHLTKIESANKSDVFNFTYSNARYWDQPQLYHNRQMAQNVLSPCGRNINGDNTYVTTSTLTDFKIKQSTLSAIKHNGVVLMNFYHETDRLDLKGRKELDRIEIQYGLQPIKTFTFNHSYFKSSSSPTSEEGYRLKLNGITITGHTPSSTESQEYTFAYFGDNHLPSRESLSIDFSGYYNGKNNTTLIPSHMDKVWGTFSGANREPDFNYKIKGTLKEIYYPTGGSTTFAFDKFLVGTEEKIKTSYENIGGVAGGSGAKIDRSDFPCDDAIEYLPNMESNTFTVGENEIYTKDITKYYFNVKKRENPNQGEHSGRGRLFYMAIYKTTPAPSIQGYSYVSSDCIQIDGIDPPFILCKDECKRTPNGPDGQPFKACYNQYIKKPETYCEFKNKVDNGTIDLVYSGYAVPSHNDQLLFPPDFKNTIKEYLDPGTYGIFMVNSLWDMEISLNRTFVEVIDVEKWSATPYLSRIIDKTNQGETYTKHLEYLESNVQQQVQLHTIKETRDNTTGECYVSGDHGIYKSLERHTSNVYSATPNEITYPKVRETVEDAAGNTLGSTLYEFYDQKFYVTTQPYTTTTSYNPVIGEPYIENNPLNGQLKRVSHYDNTGRILKSNTSIYDFESSVVTTGTNFYGGLTILDVCTVAIPGEINPNLKKLDYWASTDLGSSGGNLADNFPGKVCSTSNGNIALGGWSNVTGYSDTNLRFYKFRTQLKESIAKDYFYTANGKKDSILQKIAYTYGTHHNLPIAVTSTTNKENTRVTTTQYPQDLQNPTLAEQGLINQHRIATPIRVELVEKNKENTLLSTQTQYTQYDNNWGNTLILAKNVQAVKGVISDTNKFTARIQYHRYDEKGNPIEVSQTDGSHIVYIWGYNDQYPIAKIQNATYGEVEPYIADLKTKSYRDIDRTRNYNGYEGKLRQSLDNLRAALPNTMVTTYTYDPLIGVTSMTDPKGYTVYYEYDGFNRLEHIRDAEENITNKYYYNYAGEAIAPLAVTISSTKNWMFTGSSLSLQSDITGGSGDFTYAWKITKPGNQLTQSTSKDVSLQGGSTKGMAAIELSVRDKVTGLTKTNTKAISIYNPLSVSTGSISRPANHVVNRTAAFNISPAEGSGNYSYSWKISRGGAIHTTSQKSFNLMMGCAYYGPVQVECTVRDTITDESKTVTTTMNVVEPAPLTLSIASMPPVSSAPRTQKFQVLANINGGLGSYTYTWYVNGSRVSSASSIYITLYCGTTSNSATVDCTVTDRCTGRTVSKKRQTYTMNSTLCRNTDDGNPRDGNPRDDSDDSKQ